jgi:hypothetical protein
MNTFFCRPCDGDINIQHDGRMLGKTCVVPSAICCLLLAAIAYHILAYVAYLLRSLACDAHATHNTADDTKMCKKTPDDV